MGSALKQLDHITGNTIIQFTETDPATTRHELWKTKGRDHYAIAARFANLKPTATPEINIDIQKYKLGSDRDFTSYRLSNFYFNPSFIAWAIFSLMPHAFCLADSNSFSASFNSCIKSGYPD